MWHINHIEFENFISFQEAVVDIPQNICTLIYGINKDNAKQKNNGTGKSSLIEAIAFGLTGEALRGVDKTEEIINDHADSATVYMELNNDFDNTKLSIQRTIYRKQPQQIECHKYNADGEEIETEKTVQPSVLDYNRFILNEIGLTKDDIYNNYILSNQRYKSFFEANDKQKKAMINRFSGADAVDKAIEALETDKQPVQEAYDKAKDLKIAADAKVEAIEQQINDFDNSKEDFEKSKAERINALEDKIASNRSEIRDRKEDIKELNAKLDKIDEAGAQIEEMQKDKLPLSDVYEKVNSLLEKHDLRKTYDYVSLAKKYDDIIESKHAEKKMFEKELVELNCELDKANESLNKAKRACEEAKKQNEIEDKHSAKRLDAIFDKIHDLEEKMDSQSSKIKDLKKNSDSLDSKIREARNMLHGAITCPKCGHEFFLNEDKDVKEVKEDLTFYQAEFDKNEQLLSEAQKEDDKMKKESLSLADQKEDEKKAISDREDNVRELEFDVNKASVVVSQVSSSITDMNSKIHSVDVDIDDNKERISNLVKKIFQESLDIIDSAIDTGENKVKKLSEVNVAAQSTIEAYEKSIEDIRNSSQDDLKVKLEQTLAELKKSQQDALNELDKAQKELDKYTIQENHFVEFRSYLANKKVEAISGVTNYFLKLIGSDLRVEMLGFKRLKNGSIRDKITVNLLRNGENCGSFGKYSAGERARVNLASILGLQKLTNDSAELGKGLGLVVLDEILEASDTTGIEASCKALNRLGVTSLVVTQNPIAGDGINTMEVVKENGISTINQ